MNDIFVRGVGAVSPAGWGLEAFRRALVRGTAEALKELPRPGAAPLKVLRVPPAQPRPAFMSDPRLRRTSPISQYAVGAALEALGETLPRQNGPAAEIGIVFCVMTGCVNYSRRFYDEVLKDPSVASPLLFPETVLNAPASHLAALLGTGEMSYTLVGDPATFLQGLAVAAEWLLENRVELCLVVAAEEIDWLVTEGLQLFHRNVVASEGAGALCLSRQRAISPAVTLSKISSPHLLTNGTSRLQAALQARAELGEAPGTCLLCDGLQGVESVDRDETQAWSNWTGDRLSPKRILGEGLAAGSAWQCVAAVDALSNGSYTAANVSVVGLNQQAIAAQFTRV